MFDDEMAVNKRWWDGATPVHVRSRSYNVDGFRTGVSSLLPTELRELGDVRGKSLLHLQCHFGMDTLSWAREGAVVTGVDFSPEAIATARSLAADLSIPARFIESNVYTLPEVLDEKFDIVYTGYGAICWLPDLERWAKVIARFLRPGGTFYIVEAHPFTDLIDENVTDRVSLTGRYFSKGPVRYESPNTYTDSVAPLDEQVTYSWLHPLSETVSSLCSAGLQVEWLHESPLGFFNLHPLMKRREDGHWQFPDGTCDIPLTFSLRARLPD
ncbi:MAG: methyltransferase domain-containing protein [Methanomassiliicoccus sp.]|nr:methyltransferase domain-containing protein [Methanomassiliicoccus sp.]